MHDNLFIFKISKMRKIYILLLGIIFSYSVLQGQVTISMSSSTVNQGQQAMVDVTVDGFTNILVAQFSINYDSLVLQYGSTINFSNTLLGLSSVNVSGPNGVGVQKGQMTFSWSDPDGTGKTLPNGTRLFTIVFNAIGNNGTSSEVFTSNQPRIIEIVNSNFDELNLVNNRGTVTIGSGPPPTTCVDPMCSNPNNLTILGETVSASQGEIVCVPVRVRNFNMMQSGQGSITWNNSILRFEEIRFPSSGGIPNFNNSFNIANAPNGNIRYVWFNNEVANPVTLPANTLVMELCYEVLASEGQGCIRFGETGTGLLETFWENNDGEIPICYTYGKINIGGGGGDEVRLLTASGAGNQGATVCLDVTVENFNNIFSARTKYRWNPTELKFLRTEMYGLDGLNASAFSTSPQGSSSPNELDFLWVNADGISRPDGHIAFKICFELLCPTQNNYTAMITTPGPTEVNGTVNGQPDTVPATVTGGSISITCGVPPPTCSLTLGTVTNVSCNGASNGSAVMTVTNAGNDCVYQWRRGTTIIKTGLVSSGTNLTNAPAGTYDFEVLCSGVSRCIQTGIVINQPAVITIPVSGVVTDAGCSGSGSINISGTSGGNGGFNYVWNPDQGNTANPTNLAAGAYTVTVTDSRGCTAQASFTVGENIQDLSLSFIKTDVRCNGEANGTAVITVSGGCPPHSFAWSATGITGSMPQNLTAGSYTVTVSDNFSPANTATVTLTITQPMPLNVAVTTVVNSNTPTSNDGRIVINATGGTMPYTIVWSGPTSVSNNTVNAMNLQPGTYGVVVTDANGCTFMRSNIVVDSGEAPEVAPELGMMGVSSDFNGADIRCNGESNGVISGVISKGTYPIRVTLKRGNQTLNTFDVTGPDFSFVNLPAGDYSVELSNDAGMISRAITITQPRRLAGTVTSSCTNRNEETGSISINMNNTGTGPYDYNWMGIPDNNSSLENLEAGFYNVTIVDANGCEQILTNIEIKDCSIEGDCYTALDILTPNGDSFNDVFVINCVEEVSGDLTVFDRWGRQVYTQINYDNTWNGEDLSMRDLREGSYIWILTVNFGQGRTEIYNGTVTILR